MKIRTKTWTPSVAMYSTKKKNSDKFTAAADHSLGLCPPQRKFGTILFLRETLKKYKLQIDLKKFGYYNPWH